MVGVWIAESDSSSLLFPHHKMWGGAILDSLCRVGRSVGRSVSPSPIRVRSITPLLMEGFPSNLNAIFTLTRGCAEPVLPMWCDSSRSRSQLKVKYWTNKYYTLYRVCSITPLLMKGFPSNLNDTFTSTRGCAEPMLPMCQIKLKVTVKCQINQNKFHIHLKTL